MTTLLTAEIEEELNSLLMKVKDESQLKTQHSKTKIMALSPITAWQIRGETMGNDDRLYILGLQNHCKW